MFLLWAVLLGIGQVLTISDSRFYQFGSFFVSIVIVSFGGSLWRRWKKKKGWGETEQQQ